MLTELLRKERFDWDNKTQKAFPELKQCMIISPVLALPNLTKVFVVESDASGVQVWSCFNAKPMFYIIF